MIFWIPAQAVTGSIIHNNYLKQEYEKSKTFLEENDSKQELKSSELLDTVKNAKEMMGEIKEKTIVFVDEITNLFVIFAIEAVILPILTFYIGGKLISWLFGRKTRVDDFANYVISKIKGSDNSEITN